MQIVPIAVFSACGSLMRGETPTNKPRISSFCIKHDVAADKSQHGGGLHLHVYAAICPRTGGEAVVTK